MKELPIHFNGDMVRAILAGRKTQTRRVICLRHVHDIDDTGTPMRKNRNGIWGKAPCPYGQPGDRLWVRERWAVDKSFDDLAPCMLPVRGMPVFYYATTQCLDYKWRPSIHMPRWGSRITLEVTDVRVQRLQEISEEDAVAEGIFSHPHNWRCMDYPYPDIAYQPVEGSEYRYTSPKDTFKDLWASIKGTWDANPWVRAVSFKVVAP